MTLSIQRVKRIVRQIDPRIRYRIERDRRIRSAYDAKLDQLGRASKQRFEGTILVDGKWDNPHYWFRYALLRAGLGLSHGKEVGLLGAHRRREQTRTMKQLGFADVVDLQRYKPNRKIKNLADRLIETIGSPDDILRLNLPYEFPAGTFYDCILKQQRQAFVQIDHPEFRNALIEYLVSLEAADDLLKKHRPRLVVSSHAIGSHACLVWLALRHGIPTIIPFGDVGISRFWRPQSNGEFFDFFDRVTWEEYLSLSKTRQSTAQQTGSAYLIKRFGGDLSNLGAHYAYKKRERRFDRETACRQFGWDLDRPIITVYASNWFDFPHSTGMKGFRDYYDWMLETIGVARKRMDINWLFKSHPLNEWYGGLTLEDAVGPLDSQHIRMADTSWNGLSMLQGVDGIVTFQGTIGVEAPAMGTPVLTAQRGWYGDWQFVTAADDRDSYLEKLRTNWWEQSPTQQEERKRRALAFACLYWARPEWQDGFLLRDDSEQWSLYGPVMDLIDRCPGQIDREIDLIGQWYDSEHGHFHAYKMLRTSKWIV